LSAILDLIGQVDDTRLRERLQREWGLLSREKKFGLVYEEHLPELLALFDLPIAVGDLVAKRDGDVTAFWRVTALSGGVATAAKAGGSTADSGTVEVPVSELVTLKQFGDPIFPTLEEVDSLQGGNPQDPWHALIEADNFHALQLLEYLYGGKVDCIYIDPPYNTGARDWKYNNDYVDANDSWRHSKWLSFMERRLRIAKKLLKPDVGVLIVTIDEHEVHHLGMLLEEVFPECALQTATIVINQKGVAQGRLARTEEYALFAFKPGAFLRPHHDDLLSPERSHSEKLAAPRWERLLRGGTGARREDRYSLYYPIYVDPVRRAIVEIGEPLDSSDVPPPPNPDMTVAWPIRTDGSHGRWQVSPRTLRTLLSLGYVRLGGFDKKRNTWTVHYLNRGTRSRIEKGEIIVAGTDPITGAAIIEYANQEARLKSIKTVWHRGTHDSGIYGSSLLRKILGGGSKFSFPKSLYATKDALATVVRDRPNALVVDFFAGSGTTLNALNLLNAADGGNRRCILITNNEVSAEEAEALRAAGHRPGDAEWERHGICRAVTWPRTKYSIAGKRDTGEPLEGDYLLGRKVPEPKARRYVHIDFAEGGRLSTVDAKRQLLSLIDGIPQSTVDPDLGFATSEASSSTVLFDIDHREQWLSSLDGRDDIETVYIVASGKKQFAQLKKEVELQLSPFMVEVEEKRPMKSGFAANTSYFRLGFLDKRRVALKKAFADILPLLWMKAGANGPCPKLADNIAPPGVFSTAANDFIVLTDDTAVETLSYILSADTPISCVYIVTDDDDAFKEITETVHEVRGSDLLTYQLYRDYLENFVINGAVGRREAEST